MEKKLCILLMCISFVVGVLLMLVVNLVTTKECEVCEKCENTATRHDDVKLSASEKEMFNLLNDISVKMYDNNEYTNLNKNAEGVYYATLEDMSNLSYDVSSLSHCDQKLPKIFFDVEYKMAEKYENKPLQISITCVQED